VFRYEHHVVADPGAALSIEDVRRALIPYFPDLVQATHTETTEGDTVTIVFAKQTTRKGAAEITPLPDLVALAERLLALPPIPNALAALPLTQGYTLRDIATHRQAILTAAQTTLETTYQRRFRRCLTLSPAPLLTRIPFGF
jgi:hypothetical protein